MNGLYIVFEGIDGSGKGTQHKQLTQRLLSLGFVVQEGKEPGGTPLGSALRELLFFTVKTQNMAPNVVDCLLLADHVQHIEKLVKPAIEKGKIVVSDRSAFSQYAYSVGREINDHLKIAFQELQGPEPDIMFLLTGNPEILLERARKRTVETHQKGKQWNKIESQIKIQNEYVRLLSGKPNVVTIDVNEMQEEKIFEEFIWPVVLGVIQDRLTDLAPASTTAA